MMDQPPKTYKESGVDIDAKSEAIDSLVNKLGFCRKGFGKPLALEGHFSGLIDFGDKALSMCTDGVGTKLMLCEPMRRWDTIGIDCIAMNVNDMICLGAEPLAFVDYIAIDNPNPELTAQLGVGLKEGAELSNVSIIGGEIAVLPELINGFDLAGTALGFVEKENIITGDKVAPGDVLIGLASSGIHSNGYTLVRGIVDGCGVPYDRDYSVCCVEYGVEMKRDTFHGNRTKSTIGDILLTPTRIYVRPVMQLIKKVEVHGLVNITGGGLKNIPRIKSKGVDYLITDPMYVPSIFRLIKQMGRIDEEEMLRTFNMGLGFLIIVPEDESKKALKVLEKAGERPKVIGRVVKGTGLCKHIPSETEFTSL